MADDDGVWDDAELVENWDAAHAEYMKYHSVTLQKNTAEAKDPSKDPRETQFAKEGARQSPERQESARLPTTNAGRPGPVYANHKKIDLRKAQELAVTSDYWKGYCQGFLDGQATPIITYNGS